MCGLTKNIFQPHFALTALTTFFSGNEFSSLKCSSYMWYFVIIWFISWVLCYMLLVFIVYCGVPQEPQLPLRAEEAQLRLAGRMQLGQVIDITIITRSPCSPWSNNQLPAYLRMPVATVMWFVGDCSTLSTALWPQQFVWKKDLRDYMKTRVWRTPKIKEELRRLATTYPFSLGLQLICSGLLSWVSPSPGPIQGVIPWREDTQVWAEPLLPFYPQPLSSFCSGFNKRCPELV